MTERKGDDFDRVREIDKSESVTSKRIFQTLKIEGIRPSYERVKSVISRIRDVGTKRRNSHQ